MSDKKYTCRGSVSPAPSGRFIRSSQRSTESGDLICRIFSQHKSRQKNIKLKFLNTNYTNKIFFFLRGVPEICVMKDQCLICSEAFQFRMPRDLALILCGSSWD